MVVDDNMMIGKKIGEVLRPKVHYTNHKENFIVFTDHKKTSCIVKVLDALNDIGTLDI